MEIDQAIITVPATSATDPPTQLLLKRIELLQQLHRNAEEHFAEREDAHLGYIAELEYQLTATQAQLKKETESVVEQHSDLQQQIRELRSQSDMQASQLSVKTKELQAEKARQQDATAIQQLQKDYRDLQQKHDSAKASLDKVMGQLSQHVEARGSSGGTLGELVSSLLKEHNSQVSELQKQLEEAKEFEPQAKSLQEKLQTVSKRSLEALTKAQSDKEQLQQRLQAEATEATKLRQQQQAVLAAVQGTDGSTNGTMHAAGGSSAVPGGVVGAGSAGEAGAGPPEQVQGQRQAAWALQQALPQLQEVAGLKPALEALVKQHSSGEAAATSQQLKSAVAATKDAVQSLKSSIKIELAGMISGLPQQQALEQQLSQVHEALAALKDQVAAQVPPQRSFSPTYEHAPLMDHLLEVAADDTPPKAGPGAGETPTAVVGALGAVPAPPVGSPRLGNAGTGARPGAGQAGAGAPAGRPSVGPSAADGALLPRPVLGAGSGSRAGDGGDSSDAVGSPKALEPPAKEPAEPSPGGQRRPSFMEREAARSEKARKGSPHAGAGSKRKAPDRERHRTPSTPRKAVKGGSGKTPGSRVPGDAAQGSETSHAGAERRESGRGSERRRSHRATSQEETDARAGRHAEKAAHRARRASDGARDSDRGGGDNPERSRLGEGKQGDRAAKSAGSSGGPPLSHGEALGSPAGNSVDAHQARKWDQKAPQQHSGPFLDGTKDGLNAEARAQLRQGLQSTPPWLANVPRVGQKSTGPPANPPSSAPHTLGSSNRPQQMQGAQGSGHLQGAGGGGYGMGWQSSAAPPGLVGASGGFGGFPGGGLQAGMPLQQQQYGPGAGSQQPGQHAHQQSFRLGQPGQDPHADANFLANLTHQQNLMQNQFGQAMLAPWAGPMPTPGAYMQF